MGLFDFFSKVPKPVVPKQEQKTAVLETDRKYYQDDSYYTDVAFSGTPLQRQEWYPLKKERELQFLRGLDCTQQGCYCWNIAPTEPTRSKNGYPGFWWFEYGIRDVGSALKSLEDRGYIVFATAKDSLNSFTIPQLKNCYPPRICLLLARKLTSLCV